MSDDNIVVTILSAYNDKPKYGESCNNCGWCCLTEVCPVGAELTGSTTAPCTLIESRDGKHYCKLAKVEAFKEVLGLDTSCCAKTQKELTEDFKGENRPNRKEV